MSTKIKVGDRVAFYPPIGRRTGRVTAIVKNFTFIDSDMLAGKETGKCRIPHGTKIVKLKPKKVMEPPTPRTRWTLERHDGNNSFQLFDAPTSSKVAKAYKIRGLGFTRVMWREVL